MAIGKVQLERLPRRWVRGIWPQRLFWVAFALAVATCYSAQVAHLYKDGHGARQCERCQGDLHVVSEPVALHDAAPDSTVPQPSLIPSTRFSSPLPVPHGVKPRGRAPPSIAS